MKVYRNVSYFKANSRAALLFKESRILCDATLLLLAIGLCFGFSSYFIRFFSPMTNVEIDLSLTALPKYTFYSMSRGLCGYTLSLLFSVIWGFWAAKDFVAEKVLIPLLDVFQSVPILGFMPGFVLLLVGLFPNSNMGLELSSILLIFTSQVWNMTFGVYHSIRLIPQDQIDCAAMTKLSPWQRFKWLELPFSIISLIWNSIMSMAGGWFFLMVSEAFKLGDRDFRLPGLGSYMSAAVAAADPLAIFFAILAMITLIVFLDFFLWSPLIAWSQKFRTEETASATFAHSYFSHLLDNSILFQKLSRIFFLRRKRPSKLSCPPRYWTFLSRLALMALILSIVFLFSLLLRKIVLISLDTWALLLERAFFTFLRVLICIFLGSFLAIPLGLWVGLSENISKRLEPLIQITASFPATLLFPILIFLFLILRIPIEIGSTILMMTGSIWYILFNVIAGAKALPSDLKEVAISFRFTPWQTFFRLSFPAVFPYFITGLMAAAGGAWNASIVAEYISYKQKTWTVPGLGSTINLAAENGDIPLLIASIFVMAAVVVSINYLVWLRLSHYAQKRFSL